MGMKWTSFQRGMVLTLVLTLLLGMIPLQASAAEQWQPKVAYSKGDRVTYQGSLYECLQAHTSQDGWEPDRVPALWKAVEGSPEEDQEAPSRPTGLTVTTKTDTSVSLSWNPSRDNVGVTGYDIDRDGVRAGTTTGTSYRVTGLQPDTTYTFTVKAKDAAGNESEASEAVRVKTEPGGEIRNGKLLIGYWHNFDNGSSVIRLRDVSPRYDVIHVAFAEPTGRVPGEMGFTPFNATTEEFKADVEYLKSRGKKVVISIGGANAHVRLENSAQREQFVRSMTEIIQTYGFSGMDIDLEGSSLSLDGGDTDFRNPTTPAITHMIAAVQSIRSRFGSDFVLTMAPETAYVQGGYSAYGGPWGAYLPVIHALRNELTFIHVQHYNSGPMTALDGRVYSQGTADFQVAMAEMLLHGFPVAHNPNQIFPPLREDQVAFGLPATASAAPSGGYLASAEIEKALRYLAKGESFGGSYRLQKPGGYPAFRGVMTWSINWDRASRDAFSSSVRRYLDGL
ncbi:carbohydrate-binding protein [Desmospora profundinema]|uniref:Chitinase n=1 Tax=Desmospora profundinema TaxID=1571184 RepID=A0ABU1IRI3_9BACL|nr:glycosyl hydrolase family 18 protein [Desmospora profundinema]MDR6227301.1 chitinase [Desmospora profundinema]